VVFKAGASQQVVIWLSHLSLTWSCFKCNCQWDTHSPTPSNEPMLCFPFSYAVVVFSTRGMFDLFSPTFLFRAQVQQLGSWSDVIQLRGRRKEVLYTVTFCLDCFQEMWLVFPQVRRNDLLTEAKLCWLFSFLLNLSFKSSSSLCAKFSKRKIHCHKVKRSLNKTSVHVVNVGLKTHCCC